MPTEQCQCWHAAAALNAIITSDNARPFTDFGHQIQAHHRSRELARCTAYILIENDVHGGGEGCSGWEFENKHGLMDLSKQAPWPFGWVGGGGQETGPICFRDGEVDEPQRLQNTHSRPNMEPQAAIKGVCPHQACYGDPSNQPPTPPHRARL